MPEQQRRAILLREWQGLSYREVAAELEVSQSAVETLIFRARRSLAQGLEQPDSIKPKRKSFRRATAHGRLRDDRRGAQDAARRAAPPSRRPPPPWPSPPRSEPPRPWRRSWSRRHRPRQPLPWRSSRPPPASPQAPRPRRRPSRLRRRGSSTRKPVRAEAAPAVAAVQPVVETVEPPQVAPTAEQPAQETAPTAAEPTKRTDEGKKDEGKRDEGQGKAGAPGQQEKGAERRRSRSLWQRPRRKPGRGGNSRGEGSSKKETPVVQAPSPISVSVEQAKPEHGKGHEQAQADRGPGSCAGGHDAGRRGSRARCRRRGLSRRRRLPRSSTTRSTPSATTARSSSPAHARAAPLAGWLPALRREPPPAKDHGDPCDVRGTANLEAPPT